MISVGVKELKEKLSKYVNKVRHGEKVIITDHGKEVALIMPLTGEYHKIKSLIDSGKAIWSGGKPEGVKGIKIKGKSLAETILEERR